MYYTIKSPERPLSIRSIKSSLIVQRFPINCCISVKMLGLSATKTLAIVLFALQFVCNQAFLFGKTSRIFSTEISMGGGRSLEEKKFSKRQLFHQLRDKLVEAAKQPGFLDDETKDKKVNFPPLHIN